MSRKIHIHYQNPNFNFATHYLKKKTKKKFFFQVIFIPFWFIWTFRGHVIEERWGERTGARYWKPLPRLASKEIPHRWIHIHPAATAQGGQKDLISGARRSAYMYLSRLAGWLGWLSILCILVKMKRVTTSRGRILRRRRLHWRESHHFLVPLPSRNRSIDFNFQFPPFLDSSIFKEVVCLEDSKTLSLSLPTIHPS